MLCVRSATRIARPIRQQTLRLRLQTPDSPTAFPESLRGQRKSPATGTGGVAGPNIVGEDRPLSGTTLGLCNPQPLSVTTGTNHSDAPFARRIVADESDRSKQLSPIAIRATDSPAGLPGSQQGRNKWPRHRDLGVAGPGAAL
jgi:hypothetical protein